VLAARPEATLTSTQRAFLASSASLQRLADHDQAVRSFESLSGHGHVAAVAALLEGGASSGARHAEHVDRLQAGAPAGFWSGQSDATLSGTDGIGQVQSAGYDQWLGENLLLGSSMDWTQTNLGFDRSGGRAHSQSPQWSLYLLGKGRDGYYAMGTLGYGRHTLGVDRPIDLGYGSFLAHSERPLDAANVYLEAGRDIPLGRGRLTPFAAVGHATLDGGGFIERGSTGLELAVQPSHSRQTSGEAGLRYSRNWSLRSDRWLQLGVSARYQQIVDYDHDLRGAFTGAPGAGFDLGALPADMERGGWDVRLTGGAGNRWSWLLGLEQRSQQRTLAVGVTVEL
jgi:outer membrane autotransporter protein